MPDRPGLAATARVTALPRRVSSVFASAIDDSRSTFFGRLAQPDTSNARAIATRSPGAKTDAWAAQFRVPVAADGTSVLRYRVRVTY